MRKCKGDKEIMAQAGVTTRARALAVAMARSATAKRRNSGTGGGELKFSPPSLVQLTRRRRRGGGGGGLKHENSNSVVPPQRAAISVVDSRCSRSDNSPASCCSNNGSSSLAMEKLNSVDLKNEMDEFERCTYDIDGSRETTPSSDMGSTAKPTDQNDNTPLRWPSENMTIVSESEMDKFFATEHKQQLQHFREKYNFDFEKGIPLEGLYEWVRVEPPKLQQSKENERKF